MRRQENIGKDDKITRLTMTYMTLMSGIMPSSEPLFDT